MSLLGKNSLPLFTPNVKKKKMQKTTQVITERIIFLMLELTY